MTMFDPRTKLSEQVVQEVQRYFGDLVYGVIIPRTVRLSEAPGFGQPITVYDPKSKGAEAYRQLAREVALRPPPDAPMPLFEDMPIALMTPVDKDVAAEEDGAVPEIEVREPEVEHAEPEASREEPPVAAHRLPGEEETGPGGGEPEAEAPAENASPAETDTALRVKPHSQPSDEDLWKEPPPEPEPRVKPPSSPAPPGELPQRRVVVIDENPDIDIEASREEPPPPPASREHQEGMANIGATLDDERGRKRRWRMFRKGGD
jgi:hypothetical protein